MPLSERTGYYRCIASRTPLFTVGVAYEVYRYDEDGTAEVVTDKDTYVILPHPDATLVEYDPWRRYRRMLEPSHD